MYNFLVQITYRFNQQNLVLFLFIIGTANFIGWELYGGEEQYLAFAKQFMNPEWMPHSFTLNHPAGGNLVFQVITGFLLRFLSFEQIAFWGRLINFFLYAIPLALIFKYLKFNNIEAVFLFQLFYLPHQTIWAGEWVYKNFEEKSLAYIFIFFAIYHLFRNDHIKSVLFAVIATYFHFLVGGWFFVMSVIYYAVAGKTFRQLFNCSGLYIILCLPFIIYLGTVYFVDNEAVVEGIHTGWIYANYRLPNHIGIFRDMAYFKKQHLEGILISISLFLLCVLYFKRFKRKDVRMLNTLNIIIFIQQFVFIIIAWFDKNGVLLKTYPFRTSTLNAFFLWLEIGLIVKHYGSPAIFRKLSQRIGMFKSENYLRKKYRYAQSVNVFLLVVFTVYFFYECSETIFIGNREVLPPDKEMQQVFRFARTSTDKEAVFLFLDDNRYESFIRITNRERFVAYKFTPTKSKTIYIWYDRLMWKEKLRKDISLIDEVAAKYRIDYLFSEKRLEHPSLEIVREFGDYKIYKVKKTIHQ